jgi:L-alanine-DL-glutamate epimerase-like enolase superfamily enzyme
MTHRDFALVRVSLEEGADGFAFTLTRNGPVAEAVRLVRDSYVGRRVESPHRAFVDALGANPQSLSSGVGLRALSLIDLALWDAGARTAGVSIVDVLGGKPRPVPVRAIVGYPPTMNVDEVYRQVGQLWEAGWRQFKMAIAATWQDTYDRLVAARDAAPSGRLALDGAWTFRTVAEAADFCEGLPVELDWFEDMFLPGNASQIAALRRAVNIPIAVGDEQGGSYYPEALLAADAVDVVRIDATCMGGVSRFLELVADLKKAQVQFSPHMNAHVHARLLNALGVADVPVEWGVPGTGVDPFADSLEQPVVRDGLMRPLAAAPGFGCLVNSAWLADKAVDDPDHLVASLTGG